MRKIVIFMLIVIVGLCGYIFFSKFEIKSKQNNVAIEKSSEQKNQNVFEIADNAYKEKDYKKAFDFFNKSCDTGYMRGCSMLGELYYYGYGINQDYTKAINLFKKACDANEMLGCNNLGVSYADGKGIKKDLNKAINLYKQACDKNEADGCSNLATHYSNGTGVEKNLKKAFELYKKACDNGSMRGCAMLGVNYEEGEVIKSDISKAIDLYKKACDGNEMRGCLMLGMKYEQGKGVESNITKAVDLYKKACDGEELYSCDFLGNIYDEIKDFSIASMYYQKGCYLGNEKSCKKYKTSQKLEKAEIELKNKEYKNAVNIAKEACDEGHLEGCGMFGFLISVMSMETTEDVKTEKEKNKYKEFFLKTVSSTINVCKEGSKYACQIGTLLLVLNNGKVDELSFEVFKKACEIEDEKCSWIASFYEKGEYVAKDIKQAKYYYDIACKGGNQNACVNLEKL